MISILRMLIIVVVAVGFAAIWQPLAPRFGFKPFGWQTDVGQVDEIARVRKAVGVDLAEFKRLYENGAVVIDARHAEDFAKAHLDAPMIINIPEEERDQQRHLQKMEALRGNMFVIYCSSITCDAAVHLQQYLFPLGYGDIKIFNPGWAGIQEAHLPTSAGPEFDVSGLAPPGMEPPPLDPPSGE